MEAATRLQEKSENVRLEPVKPVQIEGVKLEGATIREVWKAEIVDYAAIPREMLYATERQKEAHESAFSTMAKTAKGSMTVPGVRFYKEATMSRRAEY
jgi:hypothetical protein